MVFLEYIRMNLIETNDKSSDKYRFPAIKALKKNWKEVLKIIVTIQQNKFRFYLTGFWGKFLKNTVCTIY